MPEKLFLDAIKGINTRQNLSKLRQTIKEPSLLRSFAPVAQDNAGAICDLLKNEDPKVRKNAALLMGDLGFDTFAMPLWNAYLQEEKLFIKSSYLHALQSFSITDVIPDIKRRIRELSHTTPTVETKKHIENELHALSDLLIMEEGIDTHVFKGFTSLVTCILMTNTANAQVTTDQIQNGTILPYKAGVMVKTNDFQELLSIRTYKELLFVIPQLSPCKMDPLIAAKALTASRLLPFLQNSHSGQFPFYFRAEIKSKMPLKEKSQFAKKFSTELERLTQRKLINSTKDYELELRLIEGKEGSCNILLKMNTIPDRRFAYRRYHVAASIKPFLAATLVQLAQKYMPKDARVLDPFCGVGTMLIERQNVVKANTSYGIDIYGEAIEKARKNTQEAGQIIHYINKDSLHFTHEYLFDEIFTNMPFATKSKSLEEIYDLYKAFFAKAPALLAPEGTMILYSHNSSFVERFAGANNFCIVEKWLISQKERSYLYILRRN